MLRVPTPTRPAALLSAIFKAPWSQIHVRKIFLLRQRIRFFQVFLVYLITWLYLFFSHQCIRFQTEIIYIRDAVLNVKNTN